MSEVKRQLEHFRRMSAKMRKSHKWVPLHLFIASDPISGSEVWRNPRYDVRVVRHASGWILDGGPWIRIGISSADGEPRHDWRVFQHIKNQIAGPEWWALELYPAESQLIDPSNYYLLWAAPSLPFGERFGRVLAGPTNTMAPQRGWHPDDEPEEVRKGITNWPNKGLI
jgi:hypothetical protein